MSPMNRRTFAKASALTLATASVATGGMSEMLAQSAGGKRIILIFHGLAAHIWWPGHVEILIPRLTEHPDEHVYKFRVDLGPTESDIQEEKYNCILGGIGANGHPFGAFSSFKNDNAVEKGRTDALRSNARARFLLPYPSKIRTFRYARIVNSSDSFFSDGPRGFGPRNMNLVPVYVYDLPANKPSGVEYPFAYAYEPGAADPCKIHVLAEPKDCATAQNPAHGKHAWRCLAGLFPGLRLEYNEPICNVQKAGITNGLDLTDADFQSTFEPCFLGKAGNSTQHEKGSNPRLCGSLFVNNR